MNGLLLPFILRLRVIKKVLLFLEKTIFYFRICIDIPTKSIVISQKGASHIELGVRGNNPQTHCSLSLTFNTISDFLVIRFNKLPLTFINIENFFG